MYSGILSYFIITGIFWYDIFLNQTKNLSKRSYTLKRNACGKQDYHCKNKGNEYTVITCSRYKKIILRLHIRYIMMCSTVFIILSLHTIFHSHHPISPSLNIVYNIYLTIYLNICYCMMFSYM